MSEAEQLGYLKGKVEAIEKGQTEQREDTRRVFERLDEQGRDIGDVKAGVRNLERLLTESGPQHAVLAPAPESVQLQILRHPATWLAFCCVLLLGALIVVVSALTGRDARTLTPSIPMTQGAAAVPGTASTTPPSGSGP